MMNEPLTYVAAVELVGVARKGGVVTAEKCAAAGVSLDALIRGRLVTIKRDTKTKPKAKAKGGKG